jgi:UDP-N-acetylglucosamine 1-carboxyvinyltransferase
LIDQSLDLRYNGSVFLAKNQAMSTFIIHGGNKLKGSIETTTGKNATVAILCAALLVKGKVTLKDVARVEEVDRMLEILSSIGVSYNWKDQRTLELDTGKKLHLESIDKKACEITRASLLLFGALAKRVPSFKVYKSGGCKLGERGIRPHVFALKELGVTVTSKDKYYLAQTKKLKAGHIVMYESGDTATENAIMAAILAPGTTKIRFASANYMVQDLCYFLKEAGAKIEGIGTTTLKITGVKSLKQKKGYNLSPDPVDAMAWISLASTTKSPLTVKNCPLDFLELELQKLAIMGQKFQIKNRRRSTNGHFDIVDVKLTPSELTALPDKLYGRPYPGLNIDNVPLFLPMLTQAKGKSLVHDWCYENRAVYYAELTKVGANVLLLDAHRVLVEGPAKLQPNTMTCPPAIRPGMAVFIAMLAAPGTSTLKNCYPLERAYEDLIGRLTKVGAKVERIED